MSRRVRPAVLGSSSSGRSFTRRKFLGSAAAGAGAYALFGGPAILTSRAAVASGGSFSQSVAAGQPSTDAITLWTKVDEEIGGNLGLTILNEDEGIVKAEFEVEPLPGNPTIFKTRVTGLTEGEQYKYSFRSGGETSPVGRFRTARPADSKEPVKIAFFSCQEFGSGFYHAHKDLAGKDIDLVLCLGDYIYERPFDTSPARKDQQFEAQTLEEYRSRYNFYHGDQDLIAMRENHALMSTWDDHEVEDNYAEMLPGGATENRRITYRSRMSNGYRTFFEYMPRFPTGASSQTGSTQVYGSVPLGNAEVFLLDARQYRDNQVCAPGDDFFAPGCPPSEYGKRDRTLLGDEQLEWLKKGLSDSQATWKIVATPVMIMSLDAGSRNPLNSDSWDGYADERAKLIDHISDDPNIDNVTFVTGDIHTFFAGDVTRSGRLSAEDTRVNANGVVSGGPPRATEFVGGSISSKGIADRVGRDQNSNQGAAFPGDAQVIVNNPHIKFSNQAFKGYAIVEAGRSPTDQDLFVEYRAVCNPRSESDDKVDTLATFRVREGMEQPTVESNDPPTGRVEVCRP